VARTGLDLDVLKLSTRDAEVAQIPAKKRSLQL